MDKTLKRRLLGAGVLVALAVIIIPEMVKQPADRALSEQHNTGLAVAPTAGVTPSPDEPSITVSLPPADPPLSTATPDAADGAMATATVPAIGDGDVSVTATSDEQAPPETAPATPDDNVVLDAIEATEQQEGVMALADEEDIDAAADSAATADAAADDAAATPPDRRSTPLAVVPDSVGEPTDAATDVSKTAPPATAAVELPAIELISLRERKTPEPAGAIASPTAATQTSAAASGAADPSAMWIVQAGAFAVAKNANLLRDRLRAREFPATLSSLQVDGRKLYRVQVGPYKSKTESEQIRQRLRTEAKIEGSVKRYN